jgi:hypothetical protein
MSGIEVGIVLAIVGVVFAAPPALHSFTHSIMRFRRWLSRKRAQRAGKTSSMDTSKMSKKQNIWRGLVGRNMEVNHANQNTSANKVHTMSVLHSVLVLLVGGMVLTSSCAFIAVGLLIIIYGTSPTVYLRKLGDPSSLFYCKQLSNSDIAKDHMEETYCWGVRFLSRATR